MPAQSRSLWLAHALPAVPLLGLDLASKQVTCPQNGGFHGFVKMGRLCKAYSRAATVTKATLAESLSQFQQRGSLSARLARHP
eukprot:6195279-Pleurochrysis_carterae.AAC.1